MGSLDRQNYLKALLAGFILAGILFLVCIGYLIANSGLDRQDLVYVYLEPICITVSVLATIAMAVCWLLTCVDAFIRRQWIWGIAMLLFAWIPMLVYLIIEVRKFPPGRRNDPVPRGTRDI